MRKKKCKLILSLKFASGATLGKGLNRGLATLAAGAIGVGAHHLANLSGHIAEPILLGFFVFLQGISLWSIYLYHNCSSIQHVKIMKSIRSLVQLLVYYSMCDLYLTTT